MKFAILAVVVAMVTLSEGYIGGNIAIGYPGYAYGYPYRKNAASSTYDYTNSNGDECVCTAPVVVPEPEVEPVHEPGNYFIK